MSAPHIAWQARRQHGGAALTGPTFASMSVGCREKNSARPLSAPGIALGERDREMLATFHSRQSVLAHIRAVVCNLAARDTASVQGIASHTGRQIAG